MQRLVCLLLALGVGPGAQAQATYPDRPIKLIVAFAPGSALDMMSRVYGERLKEQLGQPIIVDNRPGATGAIGADAVARAPSDGYPRSYADARTHRQVPTCSGRIPPP
jgi:tripartite-type tricarboxylate transporter receptor subunit TctC